MWRPSTILIRNPSSTKKKSWDSLLVGNGIGLKGENGPKGEGAKGSLVFAWEQLAARIQLISCVDVEKLWNREEIKRWKEWDKKAELYSCSNSMTLVSICVTFPHPVLFWKPALSQSGWQCIFSEKKAAPNVKAVLSRQYVCSSLLRVSCYSVSPFVLSSIVSGLVRCKEILFHLCEEEAPEVVPIQCSCVQWHCDAIRKNSWCGIFLKRTKIIPARPWWHLTWPAGHIKGSEPVVKKTRNVVSRHIVYISIRKSHRSVLGKGAWQKHLHAHENTDGEKFQVIVLRFQGEIIKGVVGSWSSQNRCFRIWALLAMGTIGEEPPVCLWQNGCFCFCWNHPSLLDNSSQLRQPSAGLNCCTFFASTKKLQMCAECVILPWDTEQWWAPAHVHWWRGRRWEKQLANPWTENTSWRFYTPLEKGAK